MKRNRKQRDRYSSGFTLIEVLVVMIVVGILSGIVAPSFLGFLNNQRISSAQSQAFSTLRLAQSTAKRNQTVWQASFRNTATASQYAVHPVPSGDTTAIYNALPWQNFADGTQISTTLTTFTPITNPDPDVYRVQFKPQGTPNGAIGKITFITSGSNRRKCVIISTILGALRTAEDAGCD
ncbi:MAG: prepilin-type cleavage/methylation domain-containing protein [Pseudanabaena sp.]|nr:MAG: prepilin-type cleavage/methylation domain-containing protein [Pseudanabaena sp.]